MSQLETRDPVGQQQSGSQTETLDLRAYLRPVRRWKWVILLIAILAAGGTYALTSHEKKTYESATLVYVEDADPAASVSTSAVAVPPTSTALADIATLFTGQAITEKVYSRLGLPVGSAGSVVVTPSSDSTFITVSASSHSPVLAARLANTYVSVFFASQAAAVTTAALADAAAASATLQTIPNTGAANLAQRAALLAQIADYKADAYNPSSGAQVIDAAAVPALPISPKPTRDTVFAGVIGLLLGIGLAFLLDLADRRLVRVSSVESIYDRSVLAVIPHVANASPRANGSFLTPPAFVEVMRSLRVNVRLAAGDRPLRSLIVTSALPAEGKSTVVRDLAFAYADAGERVLVIDCDLRRPSLARVFGVKPEVGLVQVLRREAKPAEATVTVFRTRQAASSGAAGEVMAAGDPRASGSIDVMAHGERVASPAALLASREMLGLLALTASHYDFVILDTSPILTVTDAVPLLDQVGAVLFVARLGMTTREAAERLAELGRRVPKMHLAGVVVNDMRGSYLDEGHSYSSRYGYEYTRAKG